MTQNWILILIVGELIFFGFLADFIILHHKKKFNGKLFTTQVFVWLIALLIASQFIFIKKPVNKVLNSTALSLIIIFGYFLIRTIAKEIKQKNSFQGVTEDLYKQNLEVVKLYKQVDGLNKDLGIANDNLKNLLQQRESLVHLVTHKVKGSFTRTKYIFAEMLDGSFGELTPILKKMATGGLESDNQGIETVDLVLNAANLQTGTVKYDMKPVDFKGLVDQVVEDKRGLAGSRALKLEIDIKDGNYTVLGDAFWLKEVVHNLVDNALHYTKEGTVKVGLEKKENKLFFYVKDTGVGITDEDKQNLFKEGGRGKDSVKINVDSTGYGLFTVKLIVDAHKGKIWAESEGAGKGSEFFVELETMQ